MKSLSELYYIGFGPSSSHTVGPFRIMQRYCHDHPDAVKFEVTLYGSFAITGIGHHTDKSIKESVPGKPVKIIFDVKHSAPFPNTMDVVGFDKNNKKLPLMRGFSTGGGAFRIDGEKNSSGVDAFPHKNFKEIKTWCKKNKKNLVQYVQHYDKKGYEHLKEVWEIMQKAVKDGLAGTKPFKAPFKFTRIAHTFYQNVIKAKYPKDSIYYCMAYAYAVAEMNVLGAKLVTACTLGSAAILPSVFYYAKYNMGFTDKKIYEALAVAGIIGTIFKTNGSVAGATGGCQAEIGTAIAMAAAGYCYLLKGNMQEIEAAAIIAIEHQLGMTCDPVKGYVYSPCIERNASLSIRAIVSANQSLLTKGIQDLFDLDDLVAVEYKTGADLKDIYRETGLGGLSLQWEKKVKKAKNSHK